LGSGYREALASLYYGLETNRGFLGLIARPGMGKTSLLFHLLAKLRASARTVFVFQTQCTSRELMRFMLAELGHDSDDQDFVRMHEEFNRCLIQEAKAGRRFIVVIDEAQNLEPSVLETVRLLSDFETPRAKLLQIILAGQPELAEKLASPALGQLRQRIASISGMNPLTVEETGELIEHRLRVAGYRGSSLFTAQAKALIAEISEGIPRNINNVCFNALSLSFAARQKMVDAAVVWEVADDLDITRWITQRESARPLGLGGWPAEPVVSGVEVEFKVGVDSPASVTQSLTPLEAQAYMRQVSRLLRQRERAMDSSDRDGRYPVA
jgi:general secretion pathway protein A